MCPKSLPTMRCTRGIVGEELAGSEKLGLALKLLFEGSSRFSTKQTLYRTLVQKHKAPAEFCGRTKPGPVFQGPAFCSSHTDHHHFSELVTRLQLLTLSILDLITGLQIKIWPNQLGSLLPPKGPSRIKNTTESAFRYGEKIRYGRSRTLRRGFRNACFLGKRGRKTPTVPEGHKHRVTTPETLGKSRGSPQNPAETPQKPSERPRRAL